MFPKILKCIPAVRGATTRQTTNPVLFLQARGVSRRPHEIGAPPQRHMSFFVSFYSYLSCYTMLGLSANTCGLGLRIL